MIPTLILLGLVPGKWWRVLVPVATIGWPIMGVATDVGSGIDFMLGASAFAFANVTVGVLINRAASGLVRRVVLHQP